MHTTVGAPSLGELIPLAILLALFAAAAVWMFRRWGGTPEAEEGLEGTEPLGPAEAKPPTPGFEPRGEERSRPPAIAPRAGALST